MLMKLITTFIAFMAFTAAANACISEEIDNPEKNYEGKVIFYSDCENLGYANVVFTQPNTTRPSKKWRISIGVLANRRSKPFYLGFKGAVNERMIIKITYSREPRFATDQIL